MSGMIEMLEPWRSISLKDRKQAYQRSVQLPLNGMVASLIAGLQGHRVRAYLR